MSTSPDAGDGIRDGVAVVTDSTTYLPPDLIERWGIEQVSLYVGWAGDHRPEREYDLDEFYARLRESDDLPSTSQPSVGDFLASYEPLAEAGRDVVSVHIASGLSGTCESAREAARVIADKGLRGQVEVVDGQTGAGGLGCLVLAAAPAAPRGQALAQGGEGGAGAGAARPPGAEPAFAARRWSSCLASRRIALPLARRTKRRASAGTSRSDRGTRVHAS